MFTSLHDTGHSQFYGLPTDKFAQTTNTAGIIYPVTLQCCMIQQDLFKHLKDHITIILISYLSPLGRTEALIGGAGSSSGELWSDMLSGSTCWAGGGWCKSCRGILSSDPKSLSSSCPGSMPPDE